MGPRVGLANHGPPQSTILCRPRDLGLRREEPPFLREAKFPSAVALVGHMRLLCRCDALPPRLMPAGVLAPHYAVIRHCEDTAILLCDGWLTYFQSADITGMAQILLPS